VKSLNGKIIEQQKSTIAWKTILDPKFNADIMNVNYTAESITRCRFLDVTRGGRYL